MGVSAQRSATATALKKSPSHNPESRATTDRPSAVYPGVDESGSYDPEATAGRGIANTKNTCCINAILQLLIRDTGYLNQLTNQTQPPTPLAAVIRKTVEAYRSNKTDTEVQTRALDLRQVMFPAGTEYAMHDAHEILTRIRQQTDGRFANTLLSTKSCSSCTHASVTPEPVTELQIALERSSGFARTFEWHLKGCISTLPTLLEEYTCPACKQNSTTNVTDKVTLEDTVFVMLKRYALTAKGTAKRCTPVTLTQTVTVAPEDEFEVVGFVTHLGRDLLSGHNVAFLKENGKWVMRNDAESRCVEWKTCVRSFREDGYVVMLRRVHQNVTFAVVDSLPEWGNNFSSQLARCMASAWDTATCFQSVQQGNTCALYASVVATKRCQLADIAHAALNACAADYGLTLDTISGAGIPCRDVRNFAATRGLGYLPFAKLWAILKGEETWRTNHNIVFVPSMAEMKSRTGHFIYVRMPSLQGSSRMQPTLVQGLERNFTQLTRSSIDADTGKETVEILAVPVLPRFLNASDRRQSVLSSTTVASKNVISPD
ncbi:Ubiquitin carboxyl-terminal hydrolase 8, partial [Diplonema papillatum]